MNMSEFNKQFQEAAYIAWKSPRHGFSYENMPDPKVYVMIDGVCMQVNCVNDSNDGDILIYVEG